eukprot:2305195-Prymnesium_polylepis.1
MFTAGQANGIQCAVADVGNDTWFAEDAEEDKQRAKDIVLLCLKQGVNMIDTSHWCARAAWRRVRAQTRARDSIFRARGRSA